MEPAFSPKNQATVKTYKYFTLSSYPDKEISSNEKTEFFYIGKNSQKIDFLIKTFECGYAAENIENSISILKRLAEKHNSLGIIIIDASFPETDLKQLYDY